MRVRIGTRRSSLALAQAGKVAGLLHARGIQAELVPIVTSGDLGRAAGPGGIKGLFVGEIVRALLDREIDLAVHSAKDLPSEDPGGVVLGAVPERADPFDVLVTRADALAPGSVVGTSSLRRTAQLRRFRPDLAVLELRGNVDTRLLKLDAGEVDGLILAAAGLARLGLSPRATPFPLEEMVPAPGQGTLAIQARAEDATMAGVLQGIDHGPSRRAFEAERSLVARVGGGCALPLGAYAEDWDEGIRLLAVVVRPDGSDLVRAQAEAPEAATVAREVGDALLAGGASEILAEVGGGVGDAR